MTIGKHKGAIQRNSGGILCALGIADADAGPESTDTGWLNLGHVKESTLNDATEWEDIIDETGNVISNDETTRVVKFTGLLMQTDADTVEFFNDTVRGNHYSVYHYDGVNNGNYQDYFFGICKIRPLIEIKSGVKEIPFEIVVLQNQSAITIGGSGYAALPSDANCTAATIAAGKYYKVEETAV